MLGLRSLIHADGVVLGSGCCSARNNLGVVVLADCQFHAVCVAVTVFRHHRELVLKGRVRIRSGKHIVVAVVLATRDGQCAGFHSKDIDAICGTLERAILHSQLAIIGCAVCPIVQIERAAQTALGTFFSSEFYLFHCTNLRPVVRDLHTNHATTRRTITIRHSHHQLMGDGVVPFTNMFLRGLSQSVGILQPAGGSIKAPHHKLAFIRHHSCACKGSVLVDSHIADDNARHAIGCVNHHGSVCGHSALVLGCAILKSVFPDRQHIAPCRHARERIVIGIVGVVDDRDVRGFIARHTGYHSNPMVYPVLTAIPANRRKQIVLGLLPKVEADVQTVQAVDAAQESCVTIDVEAAVALGSGCCGTGCRHEIGVAKGSEEVLAGDFRTFHLEARHLLLRVGGVKILQAYGGSVLKSQDKVIPVPGKECSIGGEFQHKPAVCRAGNGLGCIGLGLDKTYVGHDVLLVLKSIFKSLF